MKLFKLLPLALICVGLAACGGDGDDDPPPATPDRFAAVDGAMREAYLAQRIDGMGLAIYDRSGAKVFERMYGNFLPNRRVAIASASKLVSGAVLFRLIEQEYLSLDTTTGELLGWTGSKADISLRQLLSFTSGLPPENFCTYRPAFTLAECVDDIAQDELLADPATRFDYGSTHLHVAGRMAEAVTGKAWNEIFAAQLRDPLGLPADLVYYANPLAATGTGNPLLAGGLVMSMDEYARVLRLVFDKGTWQGNRLIASDIFDQQAIAPYPDVEIGTTPAQTAGLDLRYGLTAWLECGTPQIGCTTISSPGAFGFSPWLDREGGYYAILGMEIPSADVLFIPALRQQLKPLIVEALAP